MPSIGGKLDPSSVAVCVTTRYVDGDLRGPSIRAKGAIKSAEALAGKGYDIYAVDADSTYVDERGRSFVEIMEGLGVRVFPQTEGYRGYALLDTLRRAYSERKEDGSPKYTHFVCFDLEKFPVAQQIDRIVFELGEHDLVLPSRSSIADYPPVQQSFELLGDKIFHFLANGLDSDLPMSDLLSGTRAMSRSVAEESFLTYDMKKYGDSWCATFIPCLDAVSKGFDVGTFRHPYRHDPEEVGYELASPGFAEKRAEQFAKILFGYETYVKTSLFECSRALGEAAIAKDSTRSDALRKRKATLLILNERVNDLWRWYEGYSNGLREAFRGPFKGEPLSSPQLPGIVRNTGLGQLALV